MDKKSRKDEKQLIARIRAYKKTFRDSFKEEFLKEKEERLKRQEVCYKGIWIPQDKILEAHKVFSRKKTVVFIEMNILILFLLFLDYMLLFLTEKFLLP